MVKVMASDCMIGFRWLNGSLLADLVGLLAALACLLAVRQRLLAISQPLLAIRQDLLAYHVIFILIGLIPRWFYEK
ncbi:hypothetical protein LCY76_00220 [Fictibacillus sp. KIGAM418]|uniref:Uncharacterized protein n=1 Tax=Fictibacillus marinisediminis TaxID=2878389 RepID=A0A9X2BBV8_9BACL|nr:hypothetical protein [Fictibacillus marinisediminis]MCK6255100.1 hypothetical protein [Fictibacillus marinisediminis]